MNHRKYLPVALGVSGCTALLLFLVWLFWPQYVALKVESFEWQRSIYTEKLFTVRETSGYLPSGARLITSWTETDIVLVPDGDGGVTSHVVFNTRYQYDIERWQSWYWMKTSRVDKKPHWQEFTPSSGEPPYNAGATRENGRYETYTVHLQDGYSTTLSQDRWEQLEIGQPLYITMFRWGSVIGVQTLEQ